VSIFSKDGLHCFEKWLDVNEDVGGKGTFSSYREIGETSFTDTCYSFHDKVLFARKKCTVAEYKRNK